MAEPESGIGVLVFKAQGDATPEGERYRVEWVRVQNMSKGSRMILQDSTGKRIADITSPQKDYTNEKPVDSYAKGIVLLMWTSSTGDVEVGVHTV